jgi:hypothetical protein
VIVPAPATLGTERGWRTPVLERRSRFGWREPPPRAAAEAWVAWPRCASVRERDPARVWRVRTQRRRVCPRASHWARIRRSIRARNARGDR